MWGGLIDMLQVMQEKGGGGGAGGVVKHMLQVRQNISGESTEHEKPRIAKFSDEKVH